LIADEKERKDYRLKLMWFKSFNKAQLQPWIYLIGYYYSYSFLYECPYGKKLFKNSVYPFHYQPKKISNTENTIPTSL
tara:strand:- start:110 stop:343 length:234 start_codon:yes stop_codon:yes gene_type:complete